VAVLGVDALDLGPKLGVAQRSSTRRARLARVVGAGGNLQDLADRLDPERRLVRVDVGDYLVRGRSSSAAKKADADFRISLARRSSRFSRSSSFSEERQRHAELLGDLVQPAVLAPTLTAPLEHHRDGSLLQLRWVLLWVGIGSVLSHRVEASTRPGAVQIRLDAGF
jgi:hypothetical protein